MNKEFLAVYETDKRVIAHILKAGNKQAAREELAQKYPFKFDITVLPEGE